MPPDGTDSIHRSQIRELAHARFDGDVDAAYRAILDVGLDSVAVPRRRGMATTEGDLDRVRYTETNDHTNDGVFLRFFPGPVDSLYSFGKSGYATMELSSFCAELETVTRYDGVHHEAAAFSLADWDGQWYGWSAADFATALRETDERHRRADRESVLAEDGRLLFRVDDVAVLVQFTHELTTNRIANVRLTMYAPGDPFGNRRRLETIARHFEGTLGAISTADYYARGRHREPVEPVAYLTKSSGGFEWVTRVVIERTPSLVRDALGHYGGTFPRELVLNLKHHAPLRYAHDCRYQIEEYAVAELNGAVWNVTLEGNWYRIDDGEE